jgi:hypothetical protein
MLAGYGTSMAVLCDQFPNRRHKLDRNFNDRLTPVFVSRLVLGDRFFLGLVLVVPQDFANPFLIPAFWKPTL